MATLVAWGLFIHHRFSPGPRLGSRRACLHTLVHAFIANRLDYCSSLYCGLPQVRLRPLNGVLRAAARMIGGVPKFGHISDYMRDVLHWLPVQQRIHYRISSIV